MLVVATQTQEFKLKLVCLVIKKRKDEYGNDWSFAKTLDLYVCPLIVREMQQDTKELNQADLPEVDPEENSAEFMGILIRVNQVEPPEAP